ncbi:hypothetical protein EVAR_67271_1 [Eumeta japonica]|uniref:Uncharacterized protein n=1 Tax=Eumeta variegata TaxID=151549 RepID=A0A4C1SH95_EUMVA|nr:hypothetical protein EVAR_67271_1 [Eumeta japonica]
MNDVQPNGEPKKIYLTKPTENQLPTTSNPVRKSLINHSGDPVRIPPRRYMPPADKNSEEYLTNHKNNATGTHGKNCIWLNWRRYKDELTSINVPLPVYRKMMIAMRNRNMVVTAQDCRRKINTCIHATSPLEKCSILPFRNITLEQVEQLRQENYFLAEQRDADIKCLHMEEANFKCFEEFIRTWTEQKEIELQRVKLMANQDAKSIENEENLNVEQQLKATIIAK